MSYRHPALRESCFSASAVYDESAIIDGKSTKIFPIITLFYKKSEKKFGLQLKSSYICRQNYTDEMGTKEKLRERFLKQPSDFTFEEMQRLLEGYGYEKSNKGRTSGSRVIFKNGDKRPIMLHKPHPGNIVKEYAMKQVLDDLREAGYIK